MSCPHDIVERDVAVSADGYCPLCQATEIERLWAALEGLSHDDLCRLSRSFNENANLANTQDYRINEWLKGLIARKALANEEGK